MIESTRISLLLTVLVLNVFLALGTVTTSAQAQPAGCVLSPDGRNPSERILRCGKTLIIRNTPGAEYRLLGDDNPNGVKLDSGAVMIEFNRTARQKSFQIMTPQAIAAVRGTRWVVDVAAMQTSTLVLRGRVEVRRVQAAQGVILGAGEGVDVTTGDGPIAKRRWAKARVDALLARFGR